MTWLFSLLLAVGGPDGGAAGVEFRPLRLSVAGFEDAKVVVEVVEGDGAETVGHPYFGPKARVRAAVLERDGLRYSVAELGPTKRTSLDGYLRVWRGNHGCVAREVKGFPLLGRDGRGGRAPPQLTFGGTCKVPVRYLTRVVLLRGVAYELGVEAPLFGAGGQAQKVDLDAAMLEFLGRVTLQEGR